MRAVEADHAARARRDQLRDHFRHPLRLVDQDDDTLFVYPSGRSDQEKLPR